MLFFKTNWHKSGTFLRLRERQFFSVDSFLSFNSFNKFFNHIPIFVIQFRIPNFFFFEFTNPLSSINESIGSLAMLIPFSKKTCVKITIYPCIRSFSIGFTVFKFSFISISIRPGFFSISIFFMIVSMSSCLAK